MSLPEEGLSIQYDSRKPRWWRELAGRRGSKAQRRAYREMKVHKLPKIAYGQVYDLQEVFSLQPLQVWLEIGCGKGDVVLANAEKCPGIAHIGADVHKPGIGCILLRIEESLKTGSYWKGYDLYSREKDPFVKEGEDTPEVLLAESSTAFFPSLAPYSNVRIFAGDGVKLLQGFARSSLFAVLMTFPDPWPKDSDTKHRLIQQQTIHDMYHVLQNDGLFYLATDHPVYYEWTIQCFARCGELFQKIEPCPDRSDWLPAISKYERKGWQEGRDTLLACWQATKKETS
jgi:tRNA (guanine-N7-)-methyltransferase